MESINPISNNALLQRLQDARATAIAKRNTITNTAQFENRQILSSEETFRFKKLSAAITGLDTEIAELLDNIKRSGRNDAASAAVARATAAVSPDSTHSGGGFDWATRAARAIEKANGWKDNGKESRAVVASSIDIPTLVQPNVVPMNRPGRILDLITNRESIDGNAFEFYRQTTRTNNAAVVADAGTKPTSVLTVTPITDRVRVYAHLSQPVPNRLFADHQALRNWLDSELREGLLDAIESEVISGSGSGEHITWIIGTSGVQSIAWDTDIVTTLRSAITAMQVSGVQPTAWIIHPEDAQTIDLLRTSITFDPEAETTSPLGFLLDGYQNGTSGSGNVFATTPRVISPSVPQGTALIGDFNQVKLYIREDARIDLDPFTEFATNQTIVRCEARVGFAVLRPASLAKVDLTA